MLPQTAWARRSEAPERTDAGHKVTADYKISGEQLLYPDASDANAWQRMWSHSSRFALSEALPARESRRVAAAGRDPGAARFYRGRASASVHELLAQVEAGSPPASCARACQARSEQRRQRGTSGDAAGANPLVDRDHYIARLDEPVCALADREAELVRRACADNSDERQSRRDVERHLAAHRPLDNFFDDPGKLIACTCLQ
jgi:hypothetical protein